MTNSNSGQNQAATKRKKIIIAVAAVLVLSVAAFVIFSLTNRGMEARIMEIFSVDGPQVSLTRGAEATVAASAGQGGPADEMQILMLEGNVM